MSVTADVILQSIPQRFRPEKAEGYNTIIHFDLSGEEAIAKTVVIANGQCVLQNGLQGKPQCLVQADAADYVAVETGKLLAQEALISGRMKVSDIAALLQFVKCFRRFEQRATALQFTERPVLAGPLKGVKVLDFTRLLPGPLATMYLAQQGADVIKIEDPDSPDYIRSFNPQVQGESIFYLSLNSNKRSLSVNFLSEQGKAIIQKLVAQADVLIEQYRPGVMAKFGLDYEQLKAINPRLIYISITGYGSSSSRAKDAGHDLNYITQAGLTYLNGSSPTLPGFQAADIAGGAFMALHAVTTALYEREKTGRGGYVNVPMTDCVLSLMALPLAMQQFSHAKVSAANFELAGSIANYNVYECADGKHVALAALEPKFWNMFCDAVGKSSWKEKLLTDEQTMQQLKQEVGTFFKTQTRDEWIQLLKNTDCCISPVNDVREVLSDGYMQEQELFTEHQHAAVGKFKTLRHPLRFESSDFAGRWVAPVLGEDTHTILKQAGYSDEEINQLQQSGAIR